MYLERKLPDVSPRVELHGGQIRSRYIEKTRTNHGKTQDFKTD